MSGNVELNPGPKEGQFTVNDLKLVRAIIWEARSHWMDIGIELSLNPSDLDAIKETEGGDVRKCFTEMIKLWLKRVDPPPTLSALVTALKEPTIGLQELAERVNKQWSESRAAKPVVLSTDTEIEELSFSHIEKVARDEITRQLLEGRLKEESLDVMQDFQVVLNKFFDALEDRDYPVKRLKRYLVEAIKDTQSRLDTMEDVQTFIGCKSSFYDYRLVKYMINSAGTVEDKERLQKYEQSFLSYAKRRIYGCPSKFTSICSPEDVELYVKLDSEYDECKLEELEGFQNRLSSVLKGNVYHCLLSEVKDGCFELTFSIPQQVQGDIFPLSPEQLVELEKLKVLYIACGDYRWPSVRAIPSESLQGVNTQSEMKLEKIKESLEQRVTELETKVREVNVLNRKLYIQNRELERDIKELKSKQPELAPSDQPISKSKQPPATFATGIYKPKGAEFTMTDFEEYKRDGDEWFSPHFYTHPNGYKMCLKVHANGYGPGNGTHLSVFVCLMRGEFDDQLKWPFRGEVTIKLLNQEEDKDHTTCVVSYAGVSDRICQRVTVGNRNRATGFWEFLPHTKLQPKYLKNDCIKLCIKRVVIF